MSRWEALSIEVDMGGGGQVRGMSQQGAGRTHGTDIAGHMKAGKGEMGRQEMK